MSKKEIICAFYNPEIKHYEKYQSFMKVVVENKEKINPIYFDEEEGFLIVFRRHRLKKLLKLFSEEDMEYYEKIMTGRYRRCSKCGCGYLSYMQYTYRDNCGCIGKSFECDVCRLYSDIQANEISDYAREYGIENTLHKLLNNQFFKEENNMEYSDELPF